MSDSTAGWTRAALVVGGVARRGDAVLLVHERTLGGEGPYQWVLPGGRVEPGELLDAAVKREVEEETGRAVAAVGALAFGSQHYSPGRADPLLYLAFTVELAGADHDHFRPDDPDDLIIEARFVPVVVAIELVLRSGETPGSRSTAEFLTRPAGGPTIWLWDLNRSDQPLGQLPGR